MPVSPVAIAAWVTDATLQQTCVAFKRASQLCPHVLMEHKLLQDAALEDAERISYVQVQICVADRRLLLVSAPKI